MYFKVSVIGGEVDINYTHMEECHIIADEKAIVKLRPGFEVRETWEEITEAEFTLARPVIEPPTPEPSNGEIKDLLLTTMEGMADIYTKLTGGVN